MGDDFLFIGGNFGSALGGQGDDVIVNNGNSGNKLQGDAGNDTLSGETGLFIGGRQSDLFVITSTGADLAPVVIKDFNRIDDSILLAFPASSLSIEFDGIESKVYSLDANNQSDLVLVAQNIELFETDLTLL